MKKSSYTYDELINCGEGNLFGPGNAKLPLPPMLMFDRITEISEKGGTYKKGTIKAKDLEKGTSSYEILNLDQEICTLSKKVKFSLELRIEKGRGYVTSEENSSTSSDVDFISMDSVFTPIINVKYSIENTRVEQKTDFEKLILEIQTDGSIHPEDALKGSAQLLIKHFYLFSDKDMEFAEDNSDEIEVVDEELLHMRKLLKTSLNDLDLSVRAYNCLKAADIKTLGDLVSIEISDMMKFRNFGKKSLTELEELVDNKGLSFGMDLNITQEALVSS